MRSMSPLLNPDISPTFAITELPVIAQEWRLVMPAQVELDWSQIATARQFLHISKPSQNRISPHPAHQSTPARSEPKFPDN